MNKEQWHISKSVPLALILALVAQAVGVIWFFSTLDNRLTNVERLAEVNRVNVLTLSERQRASDQTLVRLDERMSSALQLLERIDKKINN